MNATGQLMLEHIDDDRWDRLLMQFHDASIYQTVAYGVARWGRDALRHVRWMRDDHVEAMAQLVVRKLPLVGGGLAYLPWGPVWRHPDHEAKSFGAMVRALREEFAINQGLLLRIVPREWSETGNETSSMLHNEGYRLVPSCYRTRMVDLTGDLEHVHHQVNRSWRRALKRAGQLHLTVEEGSDPALYHELSRLYREMVHRKGFTPGVSISEFERVQEMLPSGMKMHIMICRHGGHPLAGLMASAMGDTGVGLLGATATEGLSSGAFHTLNLRMMQWLKSRGMRYYDFGGYAPEINRGTAAFKDGLPGRDVMFTGQFESSIHPAKSFLIHTAERGRRMVRFTRAIHVRRPLRNIHVHLEKTTNE